MSEELKAVLLEIKNTHSLSTEMRKLVKQLKQVLENENLHQSSN